MAESGTEKKKSLLYPHSSDCVSKSQLSPSSMPDWSLLPEELLKIISKNLEDEDDCFNVVHARSVCRTWRSSFPFPSFLLRQSYTLPAFADYQSKDFCTLEKIPSFLFRVRASPVAPESDGESPSSMCYLGDLNRDKSEDHMELPSPLQCSVKVNIQGSDPTLMKILDCQIRSLGHQYRMIDCNPKGYRGVAFLPLDKEGGGGGEFVVLLNYTRVLLVLRSAEMRWMRLKEISIASCKDVVTFRSRFYAVFLNGDVFVIDPYLLEATPLIHSQPFRSQKYLVPSGNEELFLVEGTIPDADVIDFGRLTCRVSRLDEEAGEWVVVSDLRNRVLFIGEHGNVSCSGKELPDGCGVSGNSMLFTGWPGHEIYFCKYGVETEYAEDDLNFWRFSREYGVSVLNKSPPVVSLRIED